MESQRRTRVLIVEPDGLQRDLLRAVLANEPRLDLAGTASYSDETAHVIASSRADVALVGLAADSEQDALAVAQAVSAAGSRVVFLGDRPDRRTLAALPAFRAAGWSYLL